LPLFTIKHTRIPLTSLAYTVYTCLYIYIYIYNAGRSSNRTHVTSFSTYTPTRIRTTRSHKTNVFFFPFYFSHNALCVIYHTYHLNIPRATGAQHRRESAGPGVKVFVYGQNGMPHCVRRDIPAGVPKTAASGEKNATTRASGRLENHGSRRGSLAAPFSRRTRPAIFSRDYRDHLFKSTPGRSSCPCNRVGVLFGSNSRRVVGNYSVRANTSLRLNGLFRFVPISVSGRFCRRGVFNSNCIQRRRDEKIPTKEIRVFPIENT